MEATSKDAAAKPTKLSSREKSDLTNAAAMQIIESETVSRLKKTERLKLLRMAQEAAIQTEAPAAKTPRKRKTTPSP